MAVAVQHVSLRAKVTVGFAEYPPASFSRPLSLLASYMIVSSRGKGGLPCTATPLLTSASPLEVSVPGKNWLPSLQRKRMRLNLAFDFAESHS